MPDILNKQSLINLLIDSPLREPIKINLIDIINNTNEPDLPKVYSTITKELEIFQKATERRMKLAEETIAKLGGNANPSEPSTTDFSTPTPTPASTPAPAQSTTPQPPVPTQVEVQVPPVVKTIPESVGLTVPTLDLPPLPQIPTQQPVEVQAPVVDVPTTPPAPAPVIPTEQVPPFQPLGAAPVSTKSDEDALAEIQKELDSLKNETANDIASSAAPAPSNQPVQQ